MVHTDPLADRYVDRSLPSGTINWGCFRPVTTRNRSITIDFDHRRLLSGGNNRFRPSAADISRGREKEEEGEEEEEKKRENLESSATLPIRRHGRFLLPAWGEGTRQHSSHG
ncbi:hypothetical protein B296_00051071 [Ensete ventricosum]|uniref:Uncharacterized protein n=1 Tax=Ensete ventricosum TaxID=4639 RepID=A0A426YIG1_ENSVE|nr:hypothetical protein B296_00051071 [Ensete ventricosum]